MSAFDYDLCIITQERFSPDANSDLCPVVGECGHSFTKQGVLNWYEGRKTDEYHKRKSYVPCAYKCARKWVNKKGQRMEEQIRAFKASNLVPNFALCEALAVIRRVEADKEEKANEEFVHCSLCQNNYSIAAAPAGLQQNPRVPVVGVCGHTFCASCIYDKHQEAMQHSNSDKLRYLQCPQCQEKGAFHTDRLVPNQSLKDVLMYWEDIEDPVDYKDLYGKEKAKCNTLKELHDEEMEIQKDLYKKKNAEYEEMKVLRRREAEALIKCSKLYKKKAAEYDDLKVFHEKEMKAQRDLLGKKTTKYEALKVLYERQLEAQIKSRELYKKSASEHKYLLKRLAGYDALMVKHKEMEAQIMHKEDLYRKEKAKYDTLKDLHDKEMMVQKNLFKKKTSECKSLKNACNNEILANMKLRDITRRKEEEYDDLMHRFKKKADEYKAAPVLCDKEAEYDALKALHKKTEKQAAEFKNLYNRQVAAVFTIENECATLRVLQKKTEGQAAKFKNLYNRNAATICTLQNLRKKDMETQAHYRDLYSTKKTEYDSLRVMHNKEMEDLYNRTTAECNALKNQLKEAMQAQKDYSERYHRKSKEYDALKATLGKMSLTTESKALNAVLEKEEAQTDYGYLYKKKKAECDFLTVQFQAAKHLIRAQEMQILLLNKKLPVDSNPHRNDVFKPVTCGNATNSCPQVAHIEESDVTTYKIGDKNANIDSTIKPTNATLTGENNKRSAVLATGPAAQVSEQQPTGKVENTTNKRPRQEFEPTTNVTMTESPTTLATMTENPPATTTAAATEPACKRSR